MKVLFWTGVFLCLSSLIKLLPDKSINYKNIREIVVFILPNELNVDCALNTEDSFDSITNFKDTIRFHVNHYKLQLGTDKYQTSSLDLRTKVVIYLKNGKKRVIMFDKFGRTFYLGKVYSGSEKTMEFFRTGGRISG